MADEPSINIISSVLRGGRQPDEWQRDEVEKTIPVAQFKRGLSAFIDQLGKMVSIQQGALGDFLLEELTFTAQVSPDGEFKLLGNQSEDCGGGVRFVLRRRHTPQTADLLLLGTRTDRYELKAVLGSSVESDTVKTQIVGTVTVDIPKPITVIIAP